MSLAQLLIKKMVNSLSDNHINHFKIKRNNIGLRCLTQSKVNKVEGTDCFYGFDETACCMTKDAQIVILR